MAKSKQEEALQILDDLDSFTPEGASLPPNTNITAGTNEGEAEVLAFIDEITQKSSEPTRTSSHLEKPISRSTTPVGSLRKSTERVRLGGGSVTSVFANSPSGKSTPELKPKPAAQPSEPTAIPESSSSGWGWGSVWNSASAAIQQAKTAVDEQVKNLPNEQARKWSEGVMEYAKNAQLDKLGKDFKRVGLSTLTDILNVVAPPISEHEVIQVWLSHDMKGYDGIESLVYRALTRIMEQVEGGDLIVNRGEESRPKDSTSSARDLNSVEGFDAAIKLAQANLDELIKTKNALKPEPTESATKSPISYSYVYLRVQPFLVSQTIPASAPTSPGPSAAGSEPITQQHMQFLLYLSDPEHGLVHTTLTQAIPAQWIEIWDKFDWIEDLVAEALRVGVEVVGQQYIVDRMGWTDSAAEKKPSEEAVEKDEES